MATKTVPKTAKTRRVAPRKVAAPKKSPKVAPVEAVEEPIWEMVVRLGREIPDEEWDKVPHDGSVNHDHYLYGCPKVEE